MLKTILIGLKDLRLVFRDRAALVFMLLAPFLLTVGMGFVTGRFSGTSNSGLQDIPVIIVNLDNAELGDALVDTFNSEDLADLVAPASSSDPVAARQLIDDDQAAAAVIIPEGFTRSIIPAEGTMPPALAPGASVDPTASEADSVSIEVYVNPATPTSAGVIKSIVDEFVSRVEEGRISGTTSIVQMLTSGLITPQQVESEGRGLFENLETTESAALKLKTNDEGAQATEFDVLAYMAPGMALMFLMYTVSYGGRSILAERAQGTLPRLLVSPTSPAQILGGKVFGIYLTGVAQVGILILASALFFGVKWGDPLGMAALILAAVFGATGWGLLITAFARNPNQVSSIGTATMLIFGILGGSFIQLDVMPPAVQLFSKITPNAWALDGFTTLALGGGLAQLSEPILALLIMGVTLFVVSTLIFGKKNLAQK
jgi:ABC-2 type transport system permease protein